MECSFCGCERTATTLGLCSGHRNQQLLGKPLKALQLQYHGLSEYDRFFKRVSVAGPNECWDWMGSVMKVGWHGQWRNGDGGIEPTHRAAWRLMKGAIPTGMCVLHRCDRPTCCNPSHLFIGTQSDNMNDMWKKGRAKPGVLKGEAHGSSKLTEKLVREIRSSKESGVEIAKRLSVAQTTICDIRKLRSWQHII